MASTAATTVDSPFFSRWLPLVAFFAVIVHYFYFINSHAMNIPYEDDIHDFLDYIVLVEASDSTKQALSQLFTQYNDHRTTASRLQVYGMYMLEGEVNFRTLTFLGNSALVLILMLFFFSVRGEEYRWGFLLVSALLLLNLRSFTLILFSQAAFAYYYSFFYAFACLFALHKVTLTGFAIALMMGTLAMLTLASGQIVWVFGLLSLLHQCVIAKHKPYFFATAWFFCGAAALTLWYCGFTEPQVPLPSDIKLEEVQKLFPGYAPMEPWYEVLTRYMSFFLVIVGAALTSSSIFLAASAGLAMLALLSFITIKARRDHDIRLVLCCWFIVACAAAIAAGRAMFTAPDYILDSRYSLLSVILLCSLTLIVQVKLKAFRPYVTFLIVVAALSYWNWANSHFEDPLLELAERRHHKFNKNQFYVFGTTPGHSRAIVGAAVSEKIYFPPCRPYPECRNSN